MSIGVLLVGIVAAAAFFISIRGEEQTMVPDLRGKDLTAALLELQVKELYPRVQTRYSSQGDKGIILEQEPNAGTIVKAGRRIRLVVSQGAQMSVVGNYLGRTVNEVRLELQALSTTGGTGQQFLSLKEPFMYQFSDREPGIILQQKPEAGASLSGIAQLEVVVSQGPEHKTVPTPNLIGRTVKQALDIMNSTDIIITFSLQNGFSGEVPETVISQSPAANTTIPANNRMSAVIASPQTIPAGEIFALFSYLLPQNPYPLLLELDAVLPSGERNQLVKVNFPGGEFTVPYHLPLGTTLILSMLGREIYREPVEPWRDELFLDQL
jgi:beta-lactam-binding protein with PASTA domain